MKQNRGNRHEKRGQNGPVGPTRPSRHTRAQGSKKGPHGTEKPEAPQYPMRINKYLALKNYSTRKGGDELVEKKRVFINGRLAVLGDKVMENDNVEVRFRGKEKTYVYLAYNKPIGVITHSPQHGEKDVKRTLGQSVAIRDVFPVGRLDKDSEGLMILTNDGRITDKLLNPDYDHEKEYIVTVAEKLRPNFKERMEHGVNIEGYMTAPCKVRVLNDYTFTVTLTEGKKHQIRRMVVALFNEVRSLKRTRVMNIELGNLSPGQYRTLEGTELETFLKLLGM